MRVTQVPPPCWDARIPFPTLSRGFAQASATQGHRALYLHEGGDLALALVRRLPVPWLGRWTARARVYVGRGDAAFAGRVVGALARRGVAHVRIGDAMWPWNERVAGDFRAVPVIRHRLRHAPVSNDADLFDRLTPDRRRAVRKAEREGVVVSEARTEDEVREYCALVDATGRRLRRRDIGARYPAAFFLQVFRAMVPHRHARFLIAHAHGRAIAGALFFTSPERMSQIHAASTRDPELARLQGPTAVVWHALRIARKDQLPQFDLGAVTPTDDPAHPHQSLYAFMRTFGGRLEIVRGAEVVVSPVRYAFQQRVMMPVWKQLHPLYMALAGAHATSDTDDAPFAAVSAEIDGYTGRPAARAGARAFVRALETTFGRHLGTPTVSPVDGGGIALAWMVPGVGGSRRVEVVFHATGVEYAVTEDARGLIAGRLAPSADLDRHFVLREIVKRYVIG